MQETLGEKKGNLADRLSSYEIHRHEVPYKSTKEGGTNAMTFPAFGTQNVDHGWALLTFYLENGFIDDEEFWVPFRCSKNSSPVPVINPSLKPAPKEKASPLEPVIVTTLTAETIMALVIEYGWLIAL